jgi:hypothetical protein
MDTPLSVLGLIALVLIVGVAAGIYPAFFLSSFQPAKTLKEEIEKGGMGRKFRDLLVVFQFAISITLIICTFLIQNQIRFIKRAVPENFSLFLCACHLYCYAWFVQSFSLLSSLSHQK